MNDAELDLCRSRSPPFSQGINRRPRTRSPSRPSVCGLPSFLVPLTRTHPAIKMRCFTLARNCQSAAGLPRSHSWSFRSRASPRRKNGEVLGERVCLQRQVSSSSICLLLAPAQRMIPRGGSSSLFLFVLCQPTEIELHLALVLCPETSPASDQGLRAAFNLRLYNNRSM